MPDRLAQVIVLTDDLEREGERFRDAGFIVEPGGRHPGRGTENLIVPFAGQYLEILAVVDRAEAAGSPQGQPVLAALARRGPGLARWSVEPDDIVATGERLGLDVEHRERTRPDGRRVRWRSVGVDESWPEPWRCAYMSWDDPALHPGATGADHPNGARGLGALEVVVPDVAGARAWLGGEPPAGVRFVDAGAVDLRLTVPTSARPIMFS